MQSAAIKLGAALVAGVLVLWLAMPYLRPLGELIPNTKAMVSTTKDILKETESLQAGVGQVSANLSKVKQQDQLLAEQQSLMAETVGALRRQEELASNAKGLLTATLDKEQMSANLSAQAADAAAGTMTAVNANAAELKRLSAATARVQSGSATIDGQLDGLLDEMAQSATNFRVIARIKAAVLEAIRRSTHW